MTRRLHYRLFALNFLSTSVVFLLLAYFNSLWIAAPVAVLFAYLMHRQLSKPLREMAELEINLSRMSEDLNRRIEDLSVGKQSLESILAAMAQGVMVLDNAGRITLTNGAMRSMLGTDRDLSGRTTLEVFRRPELQDAVRAVLAGGSNQVLEVAAGNGRILQANVAPVTTSGDVDSVVIVFHDLTDIRRTERMRRDFVANVSHEFKTPLTSIRGYAETLLGGALEDPKIANDFLKIIERNAGLLEALVTDLLTLARLEAELPVLREQVDIRVLVEERLAEREPALRQRNIKVTLDCPSIQLHADRSRLSTALSNLIDNAINYNRPGGEIRIIGETKNGKFDLAISDTGEGIPSEELPRIFERFYRVDKARSRESGGTGLGLSIVKHAIESHGGSIAVTSRLGAGSTFVVRLQM